MATRRRVVDETELGPIFVSDHTNSPTVSIINAIIQIEKFTQSIQQHDPLDIKALMQASLSKALLTIVG